MPLSVSSKPLFLGFSSCPFSLLKGALSGGALIFTLGLTFQKIILLPCPAPTPSPAPKPPRNTFAGQAPQKPFSHQIVYSFLIALMG